MLFREIKEEEIRKELVIVSSLLWKEEMYTVELICTEEPKEIGSSYKMIPAPKVTNIKKENL